MEYLYEQPREKIQHRGASFLSTAELVQAILGSGTVRVSVAALSKGVSSVLKRGAVDYSALTEVDGLGHVKVCQLLAALELGRRCSGAGTVSQADYNRQVVVRRGGASLIVCDWSDGSGGLVGRAAQPMGVRDSVHLKVRRIVIDGLRLSARRVVIYVPADSSDCMPTKYEVKFLTALKDTLRYFDISISDIYALRGKRQVSWMREFV